MNSNPDTGISQPRLAQIDSGVNEPNNNNQSGTRSSSLDRRSPLFYFEGNLNGVVFQVEMALYRIPPTELTKASPVFRDMFQIPLGENKPEGQSDDNPIVLHSIQRFDWERLLQVLLHKTYLDPPLDFGIEQWISVLKLSTLWEMNAVRAVAIKKIESFDDHARKIDIAREYKMPDYFLPALSQLITRPQPLSIEDLLYLGLMCGLKVASIRERVNHYWTDHPRNSTNVFWAQREGLPYEDVGDAVHKEILSVFKDHEQYGS